MSEEEKQKPMKSEKRWELRRDGYERGNGVEVIGIIVKIWEKKFENSVFVVQERRERSERKRGWLDLMSSVGFCTGEDYI